MASHKKGATGQKYAEEYRLRKERGSARGLSVKQARGHTGQVRGAEGTVSGLRATGLIGGSRSEQSMTARKYAALSHMVGGASLATAARQEGISPSTLRSFIKERGIAAPYYSPSRGGKPARIRRYGLVTGMTAPLLGDDGTGVKGINAAPLDRKTLSLLGHYWHDVGEALEGKRSLDKYENTVVYTLDGQSYRLVTDVDTLRAFFVEMSPEEEDNWWRGFQSP